MAKAARKMLRIKDIRKKYGTTFIIVHHSAKSMESWDRQKVWGSQFINAFIETSLLFKKPLDEDAAVIKRHFKVSGSQPFIKVMFDMETETYPFHYRTKAVVVSQEEADNVMRNKSNKGEPGTKPNRLEKPVMRFLAGGPAPVDAICAAVSASAEEVGKTLGSLHARHRIRQVSGRWETLDVDLG